MHDPEAFKEFYSVGHEYEHGPHSDRIKKSGWHHLCMMGIDHLRKILSSLDIHTVKRLLVSDEFWVRTELERYNLTLSIKETWIVRLRYNLAKEILFPKIFAARDQCKEHGGVEGMPLWSIPALGSPRDPWVASDNFGRSQEKAEMGTSNNPIAHNHLLDSAEIKEDSTGGSDSQGGSNEPALHIASAMEVMEPGLQENVLSRSKPETSQAWTMDDQRSQDSSSDPRAEEEEERSLGFKETSVDPIGIHESQKRGSFAILESREDESEHFNMRVAVNEVKDVFQAKFTSPILFDIFFSFRLWPMFLASKE